MPLLFQRNKRAEREGFEPPIPISRDARFRVVCFRPSQPSLRFFSLKKIAYSLWLIAHCNIKEQNIAFPSYELVVSLSRVSDFTFNFFLLTCLYTCNHASSLLFFCLLASFLPKEFNEQVFYLFLQEIRLLNGHLMVEFILLKNVCDRSKTAKFWLFHRIYNLAQP